MPKLVVLSFIIFSGLVWPVIRCQLKYIGPAKALPMPKLKRNLLLIKEDCGQVCDTSDNFVKKSGLYFDKIVKDINCEYLFDSPLLDDNKDVIEQQLQESGEIKPPSKQNVPEDILEMYSYDGRIEIYSTYMDDFKWTAEEHEEENSLMWSKDVIDEYRKEHRSGKMYGAYGVPSVQNITKNLQEHMHDQVKNGHVLVMGSQTPWIEAILLELGAAKITTLEYAKIETDHEQINVLTPEEFRQAYIKGQLPLFDAMVTYSSLEHSGLGRYGDSLNPWGDLITMAKAWCVMKPKGRALVGVPSGLDKVIFNTNKNYGRIMNSHLFANWDVVHSEFQELKVDTPGFDIRVFCNDDSVFWCYQPITVVEKPKIQTEL